MYERFLELLERGGLKAADIAKKTGLNPTLFSEWKKGKANPSADKLLKIARCLGVTVEYLMTGEDSAYAITPHEYQLILAYRQQDGLGQAMVDRLLGVDSNQSKKDMSA